MQSLDSRIPLKYTSSGYKYEQITLIPEAEVCSLSQASIKELFEKNLSKDFPHVLAFVHDEAKGQNVYDANLLGEYLAKNERWRWLNPATNKTIRKIDYFVMHQLSDGYRLVKEVHTGQIGTGETYESLWFCHNLAAASDPDNPYAFHSMRALSINYLKSKDYHKIKQVDYNCFKSIESHYGKGIALLLIPFIKDVNSDLLEKLLFYSFNYDFLNEFLQNSPLENLIQEQGMEFFNPEKVEEKAALYTVGLNETLDKKNTHRSYSFIKCLCEMIGKNSYYKGFLYPFLNHPNKDIVALTQAFLCTLGETKDEYLRNLRESHPKWPLGQAFELSTHILSGSTVELTPGAPIHKFIDISSTSKDPLLLKLIATVFDDFKLSCTTWKSKANICMRMIGISRFDISAVEMFARAIEESEEKNSLALLGANFQITDTYSSLLSLSNQQIAIGIKNKDRALYDEGVKGGVATFKNREKHNLLTYSIGKTLIAEITPYKSTKELESIGVAALVYSLEYAPSHPIVKMNLAEYFIRRGTTLKARQAHQWLVDLKRQFPQDPSLPYYFIRYDLRFAKNEGDLNDIETRLAEFEKIENKKPLYFLLKALWYSHPLKRNHPEWYILASQNLRQAFKDADTSGVDFLTRNLHRFDKLTEEDQVKCKADILGLLGLGDGF